MDAFSSKVIGGRCHYSGYHHSEPGVPSASAESVAEGRRRGLRLSLAPAGNPDKNAVMESLYQTLKYAAVKLDDYETVEDGVTRLAYFSEEVYHQKRLFGARLLPTILLVMTGKVER